MPEIVILEEVPPGTRWQLREKHWIAYGRDNGWPLTNSTSGGQGLDFIDPDADAAYRKNMSRIMKEIWSRPDRIKQASERSLKAWADPDLTRRRVAKMLATHQSPEVRARWSSAMAEVNAR
jgi:hypothetical protein